MIAIESLTLGNRSQSTNLSSSPKRRKPSSDEVEEVASYAMKVSPSKTVVRTPEDNKELFSRAALAAGHARPECDYELYLKEAWALKDDRFFKNLMETGVYFVADRKLDLPPILHFSDRLRNTFVAKQVSFGAGSQKPPKAIWCLPVSDRTRGDLTSINNYSAELIRRNKGVCPCACAKPKEAKHSN